MKGAIYYVAIATVIFSHVKITYYFHVWRYQVFAQKLTWYFISVYIIKLDINLEANGEQTKKISPRSWHILKKRQKIFSVLQQRHERTTTTKNKQKNIRLRRRGLFCIHPLTWSLESSRLKNAACIHTHPRRTIDDQSGGEQRRRQFSRTIERAYSSVLENFAAVFPDVADLGPKDTKRDPLLSWYNFTLAIFAAFNHRH